MDLVESDFRTENRHPWELARFSIVKELIEKHQFSSNARILDVGSGDAYVAQRFTHDISNAEAFCVDIEYTPEILAKIQSIYQNNQLHLFSNLSQVANENHFDFVTLLDVIEHVPDDVALLSEISELKSIDSNTHFIITVPAFQKLFSSHDDLLKHYRRYDMAMLKNSLEKSGLEFIDGGYFFTSLLGPRIIQVAKEKIKKKETSELEHLGTWNKSEKITDTIHNILMFDYKTGRFFRRLGVHIPGLSLYAVARKK
ncbi:MAG: methyltransferase domain-containing protein [Crocinitomicaceae bacterium]|nr:methyltransferase domain-containing protein [Crocinitomicaceae bacterium]